MIKSTSSPRIAVLSSFIALALLLFAIPPATSSDSQNITGLESEMAHLQNILAQMDSGTLNRTYSIQSITAENYSCNEKGYETSKVLTTGAHHLMFLFGDDAEYANNLASGPSSISFVSPTIENNTYASSNWVYVNITSSDDLNQSFLQWGNSTGFTNVSMGNSSLTNWYANMTNLADGAYNYTVWAENTTGTWQESNIRVVTSDTLKPDITFVSPTPSSNTYTNNNYTYISNSRYIFKSD